MLNTDVIGSGGANIMLLGRAGRSPFSAHEHHQFGDGSGSRIWRWIGLSRARLLRNLTVQGLNWSKPINLQWSFWSQITVWWVLLPGNFIPLHVTGMGCFLGRVMAGLGRYQEATMGMVIEGISTTKGCFELAQELESHICLATLPKYLPSYCKMLILRMPRAELMSTEFKAKRVVSNHR